jgi:hypothetical protein
VAIASGAGNTVAVLPAGSTITKIDLSTIVNASTSTTVIVSGVQGGPFTFNYVSPTSGILYFPDPTPPAGFAPASPASVPTVTFTGVTGTGSGWLTVLGTNGGAAVRILFDLALNGGALLPALMTSYLEIDTADEICAYCPSGGPATISVIEQYDVPAGG